MLVASVDPAPSLGDALATRLSSAPRRIPKAPARFAAVEIDAPSALRRWLDERRQLLEDIAVQGTWLEPDDVSKLLRLSLPGVDELAALLEISRLSQSRRYDLVVVDTAPTGHTLRMLTMPETLAAIAGVFDRMREKRRVMEEALRGSWRSGPEDELIEELSGLARNLSALLRDRSRTQLSWVTIPEPMAIAETKDAVASLEASGLEVATLIVNRLTPAPAVRCGHCDARRAFEARSIRTLPPARRVNRVSARDAEPRGLRALHAIGRELESGGPPGATGHARRWTATLGGGPARLQDLIGLSTRLVMFGGKGGVGKTTCAAAVALAAADRPASRRVLLVSTDPAHSLSDVLGRTVGDTPRPLKGGPATLDVREIDSGAVFARIRERYLTAVDEMFDRLGGSSFDAAHDRAVMRSLIQLAPPGLDELAAVLEITNAVSGDSTAWDVIVMDTAPTGHALRLLEMPVLLQDWTRALMAILLKYRGVARLGELGETLLNLSKGITRLRELLTDEHRSLFVVVTRAAALPRLETERLAERLGALRIHVPVVVVNAVGRGTCARCRKTALGEEREIRRVRRSMVNERRRMVITGTEIPPPCGPPALRRWTRRAWRVGPGYDRDR